jgi:hypothetical protein
VGQETVTCVSRQKDEFVYTITRHGDGTVPLACAELPGARTYYTKVAHSDLARDAIVAQAIADVLRTGETARLQNKWSSNGKAEARISDTQLRRTHSGKVDFAQMEPEARQAFLRNLNEPPQLKLSVPTAKPKGRRTTRLAKRKAGNGAAPAARVRATATKTRTAASGRVATYAGATSAKKRKGAGAPANARTAAKRAPMKSAAARKAAPHKPRAASRVAQPSRRRPTKRVTTRRSSRK